jgi:hypothetical protein
MEEPMRWKSRCDVSDYDEGIYVLGFGGSTSSSSRYFECSQTSLEFYTRRDWMPQKIVFFLPLWNQNNRANSWSLSKFTTTHFGSSGASLGMSNR